MEILRQEYNWLAISPIGKELEENGDEIIAPVCHINELNFSTLLNVIRFWGFVDFPDELFDELKKFNIQEVKEVINNLHYTESAFYSKIWRFIEGQYLCDKAAFYNNLDILTHVHNKRVKKGIKMKWNKRTCHNAARGKSLKCLKYLHDNGCEWDDIVTLISVQQGNLEMLKYAYENNCPLNPNCCKWAIIKGDLTILKYLVTNGCPLIKRVSCEHVLDLEILNYLEKNFCPDYILIFSNAIKNSKIEIVKHLHKMGFSLNEYIFGLAINFYQSNKIESTQILEYLHENRCPYNLDFWKSVRDIKILQFLHHHGYTFNKSLPIRYTAEGNFECLIYICENGCQLDKQCYINAIKNRYIEIVKYLYEKNCPWDEDVYKVCLEKDDIISLDFLYQNCCPFPDNLYEIAILNNSSNCLEYLANT